MPKKDKPMTSLMPPTWRVGYCCISLDDYGEKVPEFTFKSTTVKAVTALSAKDRRKRLAEITTRNMRALYAVLGHLRNKPPIYRMFRITSGFLPLYTHAVAQDVFQDKGFRYMLDADLRRIGDFAREHGIRLSFHPGQFTVLNSSTQTIRDASLKELDYHCDVAEWLGYQGAGVDDFCINVHGGANQPTRQLKIDSWQYAMKAMSKRNQRLLTLENDEFSWSAMDVLRLCQRYKIRMVFDAHHQWVSNGYWTSPKVAGIEAIKELWQGRRPKLHLSAPTPQALGIKFADVPVMSARSKADVHNTTMPKAKDQSKTDLRAHADYIWNPHMVVYASDWLHAGFDVQIEAKAKNLAQEDVLARMLFPLRGNDDMPW